MGVRSAEGVSFPVEVPVAIAGGGACGLTAALAACDAGAGALVLEREAACLGSGSMSLGAVCAAGTAEQARHGVADDAEAFFQDIMAKTRGQADPALARTVAEQSGPALDWLAQVHAVEFQFDAGWRPAFGHTRARLHATPGRSGADMMSRLAAACDRTEIDVLTSARAVDVFADADGRVRGVGVVRLDGASERIGCTALVLATCGFGGNAEMVARYIPDMAQARYFGWEANRGDGITWGEALGAELADMDAYQGLGLLADPQGIDVNPKFLIEGGVQVNARGERFSDELDDVSGQGARVIAQPGGVSWVVYDARIHAACAELPQYRALLDLNARRMAKSVDDLAAVIGATTPALKATFDEGGEGHPRRRPRPLRPALRPPHARGALPRAEGHRRAVPHPGRACGGRSGAG